MPAPVSRARSHGGDGPIADVAEEPADVARTALEVLDRGCRPARRRAAPGRRPGGGARSTLEERRDLARDAVDGEQVGPVARRLDSSIGSESGSTSASGVPGSPSGSTMIPRVIRRRARARARTRIIPRETSPRSFASPSGCAAPGSRRRAARPRPSRRRRSSRRRRRSAAARPPRRRPGRAGAGRRSGACRPRARARRGSRPRLPFVVRRRRACSIRSPRPLVTRAGRRAPPPGSRTRRSRAAR